MEKSFSLAFNPLMNVKSVKEYEDEITQLKTENFNLKSQLTHSEVPTNIPKILYENKKQIEILEGEKTELQHALENINQEKMMLENKYSQEMVVGNEKMGLLEDENKRLVIRLEKLNKELEAAKSETHNNDEVNAMRNYIQSLQHQNEQTKYEYERKIEEMNIKFKDYQKTYENEINNKAFEIEGLKNKLEAECTKLKNSTFLINDLKCNLNTQIKEKSLVLEEKCAYRDGIEVLEKNNENLLLKIKNLNEYLEKMQKERKNLLDGVEHFKSIILGKVNSLATDTVEISERLLRLKKACYISDENKMFFRRIGLRYSCINEIITFFREKNFEAQKKVELFKKEANDAKATNSSNKMDKKLVEILKQFREQFSEAKTELFACKKYLEKKAEEIKALKIENARLLQDSLRKGRFNEHSRMVF